MSTGIMMDLVVLGVVTGGLLYLMIIAPLLCVAFFRKLRYMVVTK